MAPRTSVTNSQVLQAIAELSRQVQARDEPLEAQMDEVTIKLGEVERGQAALERGQAALERAFAAAMAKEAKRDTCPFRDDIVGAANNKGRIENLEGFKQTIMDKVHSIELQVVKYGIISGGTISAVVAVADRLIEAWRAGGGA